MTPSTARKADSTPQKHPAPKTAIFFMFAICLLNDEYSCEAMLA